MKKIYKNNNISFNLAMKAEFEQRSTDVPMCQHPGCQNSAIQCTIPPVYDKNHPEWENESYEYYCHTHAAEHGYCCCCGTFIAGWIENDDVCENCRDEIDNNEREEDEYFDDNY